MWGVGGPQHQGDAGWWGVPLYDGMSYFIPPPLSRIGNGEARDRWGPRTRAGAKMYSLVGFGASWQRVGLDVEDTVVDEVVELVEGRVAALKLMPNGSSVSDDQNTYHTYA